MHEHDQSKQPARRWSDQAALSSSQRVNRTRMLCIAFIFNTKPPTPLHLWWWADEFPFAEKKRWLKISGAACISDSSIDMPGNIPPMPLSWMWPDCRGRSKDSPLTSSLIEGISNSPCVATTPFLLHLCFPVAPRHTQDKDLHTCRALDAYSVFPWGDNEMIDYMMYSEF